MIVSNKAVSDKIVDLVRRGANLPPMPVVGTELLTLLRRPPETMNIRKLSALIESDPALSTQLLKMANSPVYGVVRRVASVSHAIVLIGLEETTSFLNYYLMRKVVPQCPELNHFSAEAFWAHSWACAAAAKSLGRPEFQTICPPGELYLAGLLHDLGKMVLAIHLPDEFGKCLDLAHERGTQLFEVEREILGTDHATLGAFLLERWNLPKTIQEGVAFHHAPEEAPGTSRSMPALIQLADDIVRHCGVGDAGNPGDANPADSWICQQGQSPFVSPEVLESLLQEITEAARKKASLLDPKRIAEKDEPEEGEEALADGGATETEREHTQEPVMIGHDADKGLWSRFREAFVSIFE